MKTLTNSFKISTAIATLAFTTIFIGCSAVNNDVESLTDDDIAIAAEVIAESMSDDNSGVMNSLYDAVSTVDNSGISYGSQSHQKAGPENSRSGRGQERNFTYSYDSATGIHTTEYNRNVITDVFTKSVSVVNTHLFLTPENEFVEFPKVDYATIESVDYTSNRNGSSTAPNRTSEFARADSFFISGLHSSSSTLAIEGTHESTGSTSGTFKNGTEASRNFDINFELTNVSIVKDSLLIFGNLEQGVTGTITYSMNITRTLGEESDVKEISGEIELVGDGTALLKFKKIAKVIRFNLTNGTTEEE